VAMAAYPWPGNIRQLVEAVRYALAFAQCPTEITLNDLPSEIQVHYNGLNERWDRQDRQVIDALVQLARQMFDTAFGALRQGGAENWEKIVDYYLGLFSSWLNKTFGAGLLGGGEGGCYAYLSSWCGSAKAKRLLHEVVRTLKNSPEVHMSAREEKGLGRGDYPTFARFFGLSYRSFCRK